MENNSALCDDITEFCVDSTKPTAFFSLNIFSVIFNTVNLVFLTKLDQSRKKFVILDRGEHRYM